jgi:hypothetical protein
MDRMFEEYVPEARIEYDPERRIRVILDTILPSIMYCVKGKEARLRMLENNRLKARDLNAQCGNKYDNLEEYFMEARHYVEAEL